MIQFHVVSRHRERFFELLNGVLDAMRHEPMFSHDDVLQVQIDRPYRRAWHEALPSLLVEPRDISVWEALRADRKTSS